MLTKKFKGNKFYEVTRYIFKYGNETDELDASTTVWDSFEKAIAYIERYATGLKFESASIEEVIVDREITANDYKHGDYEYVSIQKIYDVTLEGVEDFTKGKIVYFGKEEKEEHFKVEDDTEKTEIPYVYEETEEKVISIYENLSKHNNHAYKIYKHVDGKWVFFKDINWKPYYKIGKSGKMFRFGKFETPEQARQQANKKQEANNYPYDVYICKLDMHGNEITYLF